MRYLVPLLVAGGIIAGVHGLTNEAFANRWDDTYKRLAVINATDAGDNCVTVSNGAYVKVSCSASDGGPLDTYVGAGAADGGASCLLADAGVQCDLIRFSLGEKFYSQLPGPYLISAGNGRVCVLQALGVPPICSVFEGRDLP